MFTIKVFYNHRVNDTELPGGKSWIYTTRLYQCDHVAVQDMGRTIMVSGYMNNGSSAVNETVYPYEDSTGEGREMPTVVPKDHDRDREICTKIIVENSNGKTTQVVKVDENIV